MSNIQLGVSWHGGISKWTVYLSGNLTKMGDLGVSLFQETSNWLNLAFKLQKRGWLAQFVEVPSDRPISQSQSLMTPLISDIHRYETYERVWKPYVEPPKSRQNIFLGSDNAKRRGKHQPHCHQSGEPGTTHWPARWVFQWSHTRVRSWRCHSWLNNSHIFTNT